MARRYSLQRNAVRMSPGGVWIIKDRIIGMFSIRITRIRRIMMRMKSTNQLIDVTGRLPAKTLVLLEDGRGVLSPFTANVLAKNFDPTIEKEGDE